MATRSPVGGRRVVARAWLTGLLVCSDLAIVGIVSLVWRAQARGQVGGAAGATLDLLGISAAAGAVILFLALAATVAVIRGRSRRGSATAAWSLAWLRLVAVIVALAAIAVIAGVGAVIGLVETFAAGLAVLDAAVAVAVAGTTRRLAGSSGQGGD
jgi:hypothetical protein